jgi:hypothetical protein
MSIVQKVDRYVEDDSSEISGMGVIAIRNIYNYLNQMRDHQNIEGHTECKQMIWWLETFFPKDMLIDPTVDAEIGRDPQAQP